MGCFRWFFLSATILTNLTFLVTAQTQLNYVYHFCGTTGNYTNSSSSSSYANNLNQLLSSLSANVTTSSNGFNNMTTGQSPDTVYGAFLCRGDVSIQFCQTCVDAARTDITQRCPNQKESIIWFDQCMLRYSNQSFFSVTQTYPGYYMWNMFNTTDPERFNRILGDLMNGLVTEAVEGSSSSRALFGTKEVAFNSSQRIYGLVQCTPDLIRDDCGVCLREAISRIPTCCDRKQGGRVIFPSCNLRYEIYPFFESRPTASPSPSPLVSLPPTPLMPPPLTNSTTPEGKGKNSSRIVIVVVIPSAFAFIILCPITFCLCRRKRRTKQRTTRRVEDVEDISTVESLQFNFETVKAATDDFSDANKLGEGGFGAVYLGQLPDGQKIAVKRLSRNSRQGDEEFKNEVVLVAKLQHRNLVRLLGFCFEGEEKLLIYEFVPNTSLDNFIFDPVKRADLNWEIRYRIIGGIARGMLYLHEDSRHRIIHRDLKASNILLDAEMNPKISDFGMARLFVVDQTQGNTSTIMGTYGYMAPEYLMHGHFSVKSDAFSFGVLLLEIVTGHRNNSFYQSEHGEDLLSYAWRHWKEGRTLQLIDPTLRSSYSAGEVVRCIHIGLLCVQEDAADRPTMGSVVVMLSSHSVSLALPAKPAFFVNSKMESLTSDVDESHSIEPERASVANLARLIEPERAAMANSELCSVNDVSITEIYPR